jgi:hypothetical protein
MQTRLNSARWLPKLKAPESVRALRAHLIVASVAAMVIQLAHQGCQRLLLLYRRLLLSANFFLVVNSGLLVRYSRRATFPANGHRLFKSPPHPVQHFRRSLPDWKANIQNSLPGPI